MSAVSHDVGQWAMIAGAAFALYRLFMMMAVGVERRARLEERVEIMRDEINELKKGANS